MPRARSAPKCKTAPFYKCVSAPIIQCADEFVKGFFRFLRKNFLTKLGKKCLDNLPKSQYNIHIKIEKEKKTENKLNNAGRQIMITNNDPKNYTDDMVAELVASYNHKEVPNKDFVAEAAETLGKTTKSIISKLVSLKVYQTEAKVTKTGVPVVSKKDLVAQIEAFYGFEVPSFTKATKVDLQNLVDSLT